MSAAIRFIKTRTIILGGSMLALALILSALPASAAPVRSGADYSRSSHSASQRALHYDHRTAPKNVNLIGRFNAADHRPAVRSADRRTAPPPTLFFDLEREVEVETDTWYGKAGVQISTGEYKDVKPLS